MLKSDTPWKPKAKFITRETLTKPLIGGWLQLFMQMCKIFFLFIQECISFRNGTFAFKDYSWEFQSALFLLNVYYLRWIFRPANTNQVRCFKLLDNRWPWCQRLFMRGFRFRSILYSERRAHIYIHTYILYWLSQGAFQRQYMILFTIKKCIKIYIKLQFFK